MKSWQTTVAGIAAIVAAIATAISHELDGDAMTSVDWGVVVGMIVAGVGLTRARDNKRTSEDVGAKPPFRSNHLPLIAGLAILPLVLAGGCTQALSQPVLPQDAQEQSQGWTDADQSQAGHVQVNVYEGATVHGDIRIDVWVEAVSGNQRDGRGAEQTGSVADTSQAPVTDVKPDIQLEIPLIP